jgi:uncharacterized membrane protein
MEMELFNPATVTLALTGLVFWGVAAFMERNPPRRINHLYGYRTPRSMASQDAWDFAQIYSAKVMNKTGRILIFIGLVWSFLPGLLQALEVVLSVFVVIAACIHLLLETEGELKKRFESQD